ncbi:hypothetical protein HIM_11533 [Hirsutella minnesotensis 3608]|uniref:Oxidoreductase n=1 Tax=Hirsutella minnesotensis 3608 TaxID=1043627 RepID=A0A0F7ZR67_9HYPO|nr:hypothetical protein HIM_11533 [Hirsutella minnesotensis 3608]
MAKVWFITGSSRGLGLAIAERALESGASVIGTARDPGQLKHLTLKYGADKFLPVALDVADNNEVINAVKAGHDKFGQINVVVNNAGYADTAAVEDVDLRDFRAQIDTNFFGTVHVSKAVLPILRQQGSGHIIQVSSVMGRLSYPGLSAYISAKWAVTGFSTGLAKEVAPLGIKITVLEPGNMRTDWAGASMKIPPISEPYEQTVGALAKGLKNIPGNQLSCPQKIASIVIELSETEDAPLRLLVGSDAVERAEKAAEALTVSDRHWRNTSLSSI